MKIKNIKIKNFRRLECVNIDIESDETVFVGPNNSGKTSATVAMRCFIDNKDFKVHDFSVSRAGDFDAFIKEDNSELLPAIELDIWFTVDPDSIEFGRAFSLLPKLSDGYTELGIRLKFEASDADRLRSDYLEKHPPGKDGLHKQSLFHYLSVDRNLNKYFHVSYYSLERVESDVITHLLNKDEGKKLLQNLVRVDFVDAQRNIDDDEAHRSNRLSAAFASYYKKNLEQAEMSEEANQVIDENNQRLTEHYERHFDGLMKVIQGLGVPSVHDRDLRVVSSLSPDTVLQGNTDLFYVDRDRDHQLPEAYNGLGFKNLVYMAIQISHFHLQWMRTTENRPLTQIIFIEEPEVHLHAQVQQTFISNISAILNNAAQSEDDMTIVPQLVVTTHSAHILDTVQFSKVRYFRRCGLEGEDPTAITTFNASEVRNLRNFKPDAIKIDGNEINEEEALTFLRRYLRLTHCDLFFADAAILVEGAVEKLLLPRMVEKSAPALRQCYITILEVGGAYAHRFTGLLKFLSIPYLVITDIDSVEPDGRHKVCRADTKRAQTSNASLKQFLGVESIAKLSKLGVAKKSQTEYDRFIAFQTALTVRHNGKRKKMLGRTIEETFIYQNLDIYRAGEMVLDIEIPEHLPDVYETVYEFVRSGGLKKTDFALDVLSSAGGWVVPEYISEGLEWLERRLDRDTITDSD